MQGASMYGRAPARAGPRQNAHFASSHRSAALGRSCSYSRRLQRSSRVYSQASTAAESFPAQVCVVLGTQWGDEGKGKLVDILAQQYDVIARAQVGNLGDSFLCVRCRFGPLACTADAFRLRQAPDTAIEPPGVGDSCSALKAECAQVLCCNSCSCLGSSSGDSGSTVTVASCSPS